MKTIAIAAAALAAIFALPSQAASFDMLSCCPGENTARQARFVWHSSADNCLLFCAKATDPADDIHTVLPRGKTKKPVTFRSSDVTYYKYSAEISDLEPGTEYVYWVESGSEKSPVQKFRTAGTSGSYNFLWLSDVHSHPDNPGKMDTVELLRKDAEARTAASGGIDFVLFSGDAVKYGSRYDNWQQWNGSPSVTNYTFAMVPGNKEYYYTGSSTFYDYYWYLAVKNNPPNGPGTTEQEGCYWFLRDSVLFVGIDSLIHKGSRMAMYNKKSEVLTAQTNWFDRVVTSQRGKFRYLVVVQHDPWFVCSSSGFDKSRGNYDVWRHVFDKHKVDLALSGDEHNYIRSKPLRGDAANSDGTVYMVAGQIEESNYSATVTTDVASYGNANATKYFDCMGTSNASCGAAWIEVRPTSLKVTEYWDKYQSPNYKQYDSFSITPKNRGFEYSPTGSTEGLNGTPHRRYRFKVDAPRSDTFCMQLSEIQLLDASGSRISSGYTISYDSTTKDSYGDTFPENETPEKAVDGVTSTKWLDWRAGLAQSSAVRSAAWIDFCFAHPTAVSGYQWYTANDAPARTPVSWTFSASDDDGATWTVLDKVVDYDTTTEYETLAYKKVALSEDETTPVAATAEGRYYALTVGVDLYSNPKNNLSCCNPDVNNVLSACTNSVNGLWRPGDCYKICDSNATLSAVRAQFQSLAATAQSGDTVLYYQSSHGGYDVLCLHDKNYSESNFASDLMRFNSDVRVIVMLDACHSASMFKGVDTASKEEGPWNFAANVEARIAELQDELRAKGAKAINSPSIGWVTACDYDQLSWGGSTGSTFTKKMVSAWKSAKTTDANGDRYNDFLEIFNIGGPQATGDHGEDGWTIPQKLNDDMLASVAAWDIAGTPRVHGRWIGGNGDDRFSLAENWDDWTVPSAGDALDFSYVTSATTINADVAATFGAVTMGAGIVTFTGDLSATSFSDASKIAVGANSIVTLDGDLVCTSAVGEWSLGGLDGVFAVTGDATVESGASLALAGAGTARIGGALSLEAGSRLVAGAALRTGSLLLPGSGAAEISFSDEFGVNVATTILSITGDGALADGELAKFSLPDGYVLSLGSGGKSIAVTRYTGTWTGGMALSVPSGGLSIGSAAFDISNASRDNPVTVTIGDGGELAGGSSSMVLSAGSLPETSPAAYMALSNEVPDGYAAQFTTVGSAIYVNVVPVKWIEENAEKTFLTGRWSENVEYGADGRAEIVGGNAFTPYSASTGNVVTVETKAEFDKCEIAYEPEPDVQAAACLSSNGVFQVWTRLGGEQAGAEWVDAAASGVTPVPGTEYSMRITIDYAAKAYSVEVKDDSAERYSKLEADGRTSFPLAFETNCVSKILFSGETYFTSLAGESVTVEGFAEHESIALVGASVTIDKARAAWLNELGSKAEVSGVLSRLTAAKFNEAYLLNFDVTKGDFTYEFKVTGITVEDSRVAIEVTLSRSGETGGEINGTLNFYGAATLEAFKSAPSKLGTAELSNESFGDGDTARAAIELKGETPPAFFDARIE